MNDQDIEEIIQCLTNARVDLEQGGKWNNNLQSCDNWLQVAIRKLEGLIK